MLLLVQKISSSDCMMDSKIRYWSIVGSLVFVTFLNMGMMWACFYLSGNSPLDKDCEYNIVSGTHIVHAHDFRT